MINENILVEAVKVEKGEEHVCDRNAYSTLSRWVLL